MPVITQQRGSGNHTSDTFRNVRVWEQLDNAPLITDISRIRKSVFVSEQIDLGWYIAFLGGKGFLLSKKIQPRCWCV